MNYVLKSLYKWKHDHSFFNKSNWLIFPKAQKKFHLSAKIKDVKVKYGRPSVKSEQQAAYCLKWPSHAEQPLLSRADVSICSYKKAPEVYEVSF